MCRIAAIFWLGMALRSRASRRELWWRAPKRESSFVWSQVSSLDSAREQISNNNFKLVLSFNQSVAVSCLIRCKMLAENDWMALKLSWSPSLALATRTFLDWFGLWTALLCWGWVWEDRSLESIAVAKRRSSMKVRVTWNNELGLLFSEQAMSLVD